MKKLLFTCLLFALFSCNKEKIFDGPNTFYDGFESYSEINEIIDGHDLLWSFFQNTVDGNKIEVDSTMSHSGTKSIKFTGSNTGNTVSKASINKQQMAFWEGDIVSIDMWFYIVGTDAAEWLFIFDLEEQTAIGAGPGMRLALVNNRLVVEHKYPNPDIYQDSPGLTFPRDQWVNVRFEAELSQQKEGYVKVWQDDQLILERHNTKTLPSDILYALQGTKGGYNQIEFGITANGSNSNVVMYVDDIDVSVLN